MKMIAACVFLQNAFGLSSYLYRSSSVCLSEDDGDVLLVNVESESLADNISCALSHYFYMASIYW